MLFKVIPGMDEYLKPTELCDCNNPIIVNKSNELIGHSSTPKEAALKIFQFVRDEIPFQANRADERASETLQIGSGFCVTKSNLHVALLRAIGIPARYHHVHLRKEILKGLFPEQSYECFVDVITYHPWCECYLSNKWVSCEALFPEELVSDLFRKRYLSKEDVPTIDWDGETDLVFCTHWIVKDEGTTHNMDNVFRETQMEWSATNS
jgi:hypothetical protein